MGKKKAGGNAHRKGKKLWRRVDVQEEEDQRSLRGRADSELFSIDAPSNVTIVTPPASRVEKRLFYQSKPLHMEKFSTISKKSEMKRQEKLRLEKLAKKLVSNSKKPKQPEKVEPDLQNPVFDLWGGESQIKVAKNSVKQQKEISRHVLPSKVTEVLPGQSYLPTKVAHAEVLSKALELVTETLKDDEAAVEKLRPSQTPHPEMEIKWNFSDSEEDDEGESDEETNEISEFEKHNSLRLTRTQRNAMRRKRAILAEKKRLQQKKRKNKDIDQVSDLLDSIERREKYLAKRLEERKKEREIAATKTKRLGKAKFVEKPVDFVYSDEIPSSLRKLKPKTDLSFDMFKNFERRNMIEPRKPATMKYRKQKWIEKRSAKNFMLELGLE